MPESSPGDGIGERDRPLRVADLAKIARERSLAELKTWLGDPLALLVGPLPGASQWSGLTRNSTPAARFVSASGFVDHVVVRIPRLSRPVSLGRSVDVDVVIDDDSISKKHASIEALAGERFRVRDLGSRNGTIARGAIIPAGASVTVGPGDVLQLGSASLKLYVCERLYRTLRLLVLEQ